MAIKVKAQERNVSFQKGVEKWAYVLQADLYSKLSSAKVIQEASLRSGIPKGSINAAWDAIGEVIKAWATEGHSVAIPGLGSMRFGVRSTSVANVNKVGTDLISSRRVIFTPSMEIKNELKSTAINITCINRLGEVVKRVNASGAEGEGDYEVVLSCSPQNGGTVEGAGMYDENDTAQIKATASKGFRFLKWSDGVENAERNLAVTDDISLIAIFESDGTNSGGSGSSGSSGGSTSRQYTISATSANTAQGTVTGGGTFSEGSRITVTATPKAGFAFDKWSDGVTTASRNITVSQNLTLTATFKTASGGTGAGGDGEDDFS